MSGRVPGKSLRSAGEWRVLGVGSGAGSGRDEESWRALEESSEDSRARRFRSPLIRSLLCPGTSKANGTETTHGLATLPTNCVGNCIRSGKMPSEPPETRGGLRRTGSAKVPPGTIASCQTLKGSTVRFGNGGGSSARSVSRENRNPLLVQKTRRSPVGSQCLERSPPRPCRTSPAIRSDHRVDANLAREADNEEPQKECGGAMLWTQRTRRGQSPRGDNRQVRAYSTQDHCGGALRQTHQE